MRRDEAIGLIIAVISVIAALMVAVAPIELFLSDEPLPEPPYLVITNGVIMPDQNAVWYYFWKATILLVVIFFAAFVASFFVEVRGGVRTFFAFLSFAIAAFHYLNLFTMTNSITIYPFIYILHMKINNDIINQYYLDIGQIFILYGIYNIWKLLKE
ncbi:MAG: hypothetical protein ABWJ97_00030 [Thermoproteus sp.]